MKVLLAGFLLVVSGASSVMACTGCSTLSTQPTLANGGCTDNTFNCDVWPRYQCDEGDARLTNRNNCTRTFLTNAGTWTLYDSTNRALGTFTGGNGRTVKVQTGIRATGTNLDMAMAWSCATNNGTFTGWLTTQALAEATTGNNDTQPGNPGGTLSNWHMVTSNNSIYLDGNGNSFKVNTDCSTSGENATDYLTRPNGLNNMIYDLPGTSYGSPTEGNRLASIAYNFYRYTSLLSVDRKLWDCRTSQYSSRVLKFLYGRMYEKHIAHDGSSIVFSRHGWVAIDCLATGVGTTDY